MPWVWELIIKQFILTTGQPTRDPEHSDYIPSCMEMRLKAVASKQACLSVDKMQRYVRAKRRSEIQPLIELSDNEQTKENQDPLRDLQYC